MIIEIKLMNDKAKLPSKAHQTDAGFDLTATSISLTEGYIEYGTGIAVNIPSGYVGYLFPRSSISKTSLILSNCVGVIDALYQGEIKLRFRRVNGIRDQKIYQIGDRIGQLIIMPIPQIEFLTVKDFSNFSERGSGAYGSTGGIS